MNISEYKAKPEKTIKEHYQELLEALELLYNYHYIEDERLYLLIKYACIHHDDGKANREFQKRIHALPRKISFNPEQEVPHNVLSAYLIDAVDFEEEVDYYRVLYAILYHHDYGDAIRIMKEQGTLIKELLGEFQTYPIKNKVRMKVAGIANDLEAIKIKGFLHKCDYSASGGYIAEYPNDFLVSSLNNVREKWRASNPADDWNELQKFCMNRRQENVMVIAQTGMGKTEAGLQWIGNQKGFFVLPIRTAINAIFERVRTDILHNVDIDRRVCILHSDSLDYYTKELQEHDMDIFEYESKGKHLSLPLSISTMDQLFDFVFRYQGYELKLTTLSYSNIVIDEIQMYDPELLAYLIYGLKCIHEMGGKIAIMTATLSPFVSELLKRDIPFKEENIKTFVNENIRHNVKVSNNEINVNDILKKYDENQKRGMSNKILVVCNTIKKAQDIYQEIKTISKERHKVPVHILHSRYTRAERGRLEQEILEFGKTYHENGDMDVQSGIWVSTSLVEASLDIDFDYLFTELQDLNSLFQRLGRCNRKGKKDSSKYNCYIYTKIKSDLLRGDHAFIDETIFHISKKAIETVDGLLSESKKLELLNEFLTMKNLKSSGYYRKYKEARDFVKGIRTYEFKKDECKLRNILSENIIPSLVYEEHKAEIHAWEEVLLMGHLEQTERVQIRANIMQHVVNIPYWHCIKYKKAKAKGEAAGYPLIQLSRKEGVQVVECLYDEMGYRSMDYKTVVRDANFL